MVKISVIIPVYNVEKYLSETIESVLRQTFTDFEVILIDDGSKDGTAFICDKYAKEDERIKVVHKENGGVSSARNIGIEKAIGEYITFIDGDDLVNANMLEVLYKNAKAYNVDISCCGIVQQSLNGERNDYCNGEKVFLNDMRDLMKKFFSDIIYREVLYGPYNKLFRKSTIDGVKFNPHYRMGEDMLFTFECIEKAQSFYLENTGLYYYIKRKNSATTSRFSSKMFDDIYVADELLRKCATLYKTVYDEALRWNYVHKINMCRALFKYGKVRKANQKFFKSCKEFCKENKSAVWGDLPYRKKIDYWMLKFFPIVFKFI